MSGQRTDAHSKPCRVQGAWVRYSKDRMCHSCYTEKAPNAWHRRGTQKTGSSCYIFTVSYIVPWPAAADGDSAWGGAGNVNGIHITTVYRFDCLSKYQQWAFGPQRWTPAASTPSQHPQTNQHAPTQTPCNQPAIAVLTHAQTQHILLVDLDLCVRMRMQTRQN